MSLYDVLRKIKQDSDERKSREQTALTSGAQAGVSAMSGFAGMPAPEIKTPGYEIVTRPDPKPMEWDTLNEVGGTLARIPGQAASQILGMGAFVTGSEDLAKASTLAGEQARRDFPSAAPQISSMDDLGKMSLTDLAKYGLSETGQVGASVLSMTLPGMAASKVLSGLGAATKLVPAISKVAGYSPKIAKLVTSLGGTEAAAAHAARGLSGWFGGTMLEAGSITTDAYSETGEMPERLKVLPWAMAAGAMEYMPLDRLLSRFASKAGMEVAERAAGKSAKDAIQFIIDYAKSFGAEAGTEFLQTLTEESAVENIKGTPATQAIAKTVTSPDALARGIGAGLSGGFGGVGMTGVTDLGGAVAKARKQVQAEPEVRKPVKPVTPTPVQQQPQPEPIPMPTQPTQPEPEQPQAATTPPTSEAVSTPDVGGSSSVSEVKLKKMTRNVKDAMEAVGITEDIVQQMTGKPLADMDMAELQQVNEFIMNQAAQGNVVQTQQTPPPMPPVSPPASLQDAMARVQRQPDIVQPGMPAMPPIAQPGSLQEAMAMARQPRQPMPQTREVTRQITPEDMAPFADQPDTGLPARGEIYETTVMTKDGPKQYFAIRGDSKDGFGDSLFDSRERAEFVKKQQADIAAANEITRQKEAEKDRIKQEKADQRAAEAKEKRDKSMVIVDDNYLSSLKPIQRGRIEKILNQEISHNGKTMTRRELIESGRYVRKETFTSRGKERFTLVTADDKILDVPKVVYDAIKLNDAVVNEMAKQDESGQVIPKDGWRTHLIKARDYANRLGIDTEASSETAFIVSKIDAFLGNKPEPERTPRSVEKIQEAKDKIDEREAELDKIEADMQSRPAYGESNTITSKEKYEAAKARLKAGLKRVGVGIDPTLMPDAIVVGMYHVEAGIRKFADFAKVMIEDIGENVKPYLASAYMAARSDPQLKQFRAEFDTLEDVDRMSDEMQAEPEQAEPAAAARAKKIVPAYSDNAKDVKVALMNDGTIEARIKYRDSSGIRYVSQYGTFTVNQYDAHTFPKEIQQQALDFAVKIQAADNDGTGNEYYRTKVKPIQDQLEALINGETTIPDIGKVGDLNIPALSEALMPTVESWLDGPMTNAQLKKVIAGLGVDINDAKYSHKLTQEAIEGAIVRVIRKRGLNSDQVLKMYQNQPALDERTVTSIMNQAYSTPAPLSMMLIDAIGFDQTTGSVYEPTAGNGLLLSGIRENEDGTLHDYRLNELEKTRNDQLKSLFPAAHLTNQDALDVTPERKVDLVMTNPPFGSLKGVGRGLFNITTSGEVETEFVFTKLDHAIAAKALQSMKDNGKAVVILGAELDKTDKAKSEITGQNARFMDYLYNQYNVTGHFELSGDLYKKQGAAWPVIVLTIEGKKSFPKNYVKSPKSVERAVTWDEVKTAIAKIEPGKYLTGEPRLSVPRGDATQQTADTGRTEVPDSTVSPAKPERRPKPTSLSGAISAATGNKPEAGPIRDSRSDNEQAGNRIPVKPKVPEAPIQSRGETKPVSDAEAARQASIAAGVVDTDLQSVHEPESKKLSIGALVPANLKNPMQRAMKALVEKIDEKSVDEYVAHQLGYDNAEQMGTMLSAQQVDALGLAFYNFLNDKATIIADQTGVGKGRVAASAIAWAVKNGYIPIFTTETAGLFNDIYRDLKNIKESGLVPFIMNADASMSDADGNIVHEFDKKKADKVIKRMEAGDFSDFGPNGEYDYIAMTYSQVNTENSKKMNALLKAPKGKVITILDESHNAAGTDSNQGENIAKLIDSEVSKGVMYLSATWSKTPEQMAIYHRAFGEGMSIDEINIAFERGGVAMQEMTVASMADKGAYVRREQSFANVEFTRKKTTAPREVAAETEKAEKAMDIVRDIIAVGGMANAGSKDVDPQSPEIAGAFGDELDDKGNAVTASVDKPDSPFSQVHNYVGSFLTSLKADAAAEAAIESIKKGIKPVIVIQNTMGSAIDQLIETGSARIGEGFGGTFADALDMMLEKTLIMPVKNNFTGKKSSVKIPLESMPPAFQAEFKALKAKIKKTEFKDMPFSPIDYIANKIKQAGYSMGELTGRDKYLDYGDLKDGKPTLKMKEIGNQAEYRKNTINQFNDGTTDAFLFNVAGATGMSIHSSVDFKDQRQREMFILQPFGDINKFMQAIGRTHRVGEVVTEDAVTNRIEGIPALFGYPSYKYLQSSLGMEIRSGIALEKKMKSLNAQTSSNEKGHQSVADVDVMNKYGLAIMRDWLTARPQIMNSLDLGKKSTVEQITGRIAVLKQEEQEQFWQEVVKEYQAKIQQLDAAGENDLVATSYADSNAKTLSKKLIYGQEGSLVSPPIYLEHVEMTMTGKPTSLEGARQRVEKGGTVKEEQIKQRDVYLKDYLNKKREENAEAIANGKDPLFNVSTIQAHADGVKADIAKLVPGTIISNDKGVGIITDVYMDDFVEGSTSFPWNPSSVNIRLVTPGVSGNLIFSLAAYRKDGYRDNGLLSNASRQWKEDYNQEFEKNSTKRVKRYLLTGDLYRAATMSSGATAVKFQRDNGTFDFAWMQKDDTDNAGLKPIKEPPIKLTEDEIKNHTPERVRSSDLDGVDILPAEKEVTLRDGSIRYETIYAEDGTPGFWLDIRKTNKKYAKALYSNKELLSMIKTGPQSDGLTEVSIGGRKYLRSAPLSQKLKVKVMLKVNEIVKSRGGALVNPQTKHIDTEAGATPADRRGISSRTGSAGPLDAFTRWAGEGLADILESAYKFVVRGSGSFLEWLKTVPATARRAAAKIWSDARKIADYLRNSLKSRRGGIISPAELIRMYQEAARQATEEGPLPQAAAMEMAESMTEGGIKLGEAKATETAKKVARYRKKQADAKLNEARKKLSDLRQKISWNYDEKRFLLDYAQKLVTEDKAKMLRDITLATTPRKVDDAIKKITDLIDKRLYKNAMLRFQKTVKMAVKLRPEFQRIARLAPRKVANMALFYDTLNAMNNFIEETESAILPPEVQAEIDILLRDRPDKISAQALDVISNALVAIKTVSDSINKQEFGDRAMSLAATVRDVAEHVQTEDKMADEEGNVSGAKWFFNIGSLQFSDITEMLGKAGKDAIYGAIRRGEQITKKLWFQGRDSVFDIMKKHGKDPDDATTRRWYEEKTKVLTNEGEIEVDREFKMDLIAGLLDPQTRKQMLDSTYKKGKRKGQLKPGSGFVVEKKGTKVYRLDNDMFRAMLDGLSNAELAIIKAMRANLNGVYRSEANKVFVQLTGYEKLIQTGYWPRIRDIDSSGLNEGFKNFTPKTALESLGIFKERTGAKAPVVVRRINQVYQNHIKKMSTFIGLAVPARNIEIMLGAGKLGRVLEDRFGKQYVQRIKDQVQAIADLGTPGGGELNKMLAGVLRNVAVGFLGFNPRSAAKQFGGLFTAATEINLSFLMRSVGAATDSKIMEEMYKYSPILRDRYDSTGAALISPTFDQERGMLASDSKMEIFKDKALSWLQVGDRMVSQIIWAAAKLEISQKQPDLKGDAFMQAVADRAESVVSATQNVTSVVDMSGIAIESRKNQAYKLATMFQSQGNSIYNIIRRKIRAFRRGDIELPELLYGLALASLGNALWSALIGRLVTLRGWTDKDEGKKASLAGDVAWDVARENVNMIYGGSLVSSAMRNLERISKDEYVFQPGRVENVLESVLNSGIKGVENTYRAVKAGDEKFKSGPRKGQGKAGAFASEAVTDLIRATAPLAGVPVVPLNEVKNLLESRK